MEEFEGKRILKILSVNPVSYLPYTTTKETDTDPRRPKYPKAYCALRIIRPQRWFLSTGNTMLITLPR
jgi:hypothetical protein